MKTLVHAKLIIGRLPSFMFLKSFNSMVGFAREKLAVNMVDPYQFPGHILKIDRSLNGLR